MQAATVKQLARECGFELAGVAAAEPIPGDFARYESWVAAGLAGQMGYLTDRRAELRRDPRNLLASARSVICVGKLYYQTLRDNQPSPKIDANAAVISRYAWTRDYHDVVRERLEELARRIHAQEAHEWKICVDTAPLLERSYARQAGLGWIGRNQCLINEPLGSWFFLGELLTSLEIAPDSPPADRCGTCTRCIEACPTEAIVPLGQRRVGRPDDSLSENIEWRRAVEPLPVVAARSMHSPIADHEPRPEEAVKTCCRDSPLETRGLEGRTPDGWKPDGWKIDARRCIAYLNIELRGPIPEEHRQAMGANIFGCDICQDVCPWNTRAPETADPALAAAYDPAPPLDSLAYLTEEEFRARYRNTPVTRPRYHGFLRNVAVALGASGEERFREPLEHLSRSADPTVAEHARWALQAINVKPVNAKQNSAELINVENVCVESHS